MCVHLGSLDSAARSSAAESLRISLPTAKITAHDRPKSFSSASDQAGWSLSIRSIQCSLASSSISSSSGSCTHPSARQTPRTLSSLIEAPDSYLPQVFDPTPARLETSSTLKPSESRLVRIAVPVFVLPAMVRGAMIFSIMTGQYLVSIYHTSHLANRDSKGFTFARVRQESNWSFSPEINNPSRHHHS